MKAQQLRERSSDELGRLLEEQRESLFRFKMKNATHQLEKTSQITKTRREIARVQTVLTERQQAQTAGNEE